MGVSPPTTTIAFAIRGPLRRSDLQGLCDRVCALLAATGAEVAFCDVFGVEPDAVAVDALARMQLGARRHGCRVRLRDVSPELRELVGFMGLRDVLSDEVRTARPVALLVPATDPTATARTERSSNGATRRPAAPAGARRAGRALRWRERRSAP